MVGKGNRDIEYQIPCWLKDNSFVIAEEQLTRSFNGLNAGTNLRRITGYRINVA